VFQIVGSGLPIAKKNKWMAGRAAVSARRGVLPARFDLIRHQPYFLEMVNVTDSAVRQLESLLSQRAENSRKGLRVQVAKGGCSGLHYEMTLGEKKDGDAVVERNGMQFFIDGDSVPYLRGATLDFSDGLTGSGFRVVNPNASRTCGCGSSFETTQSA
jgi:iron-sulfur cluster assembly protein